ncbi:MAG: site-specific DNA-methyltransferase [Propionibacteriaceae bacterium]|jgi:site-specific DNA-methyltransferase (adenine-specific)|nr:site-specific DNA-methyltransferase [Propionibacteriaceae bacterium]
MSVAVAFPEQAQLEPRLVLTTGLGHLYQGDCLDLMKSMDDDSVDLIFADPPFNLGKIYGSHYDDSRAEEDYVAWSREWIHEGARLLSPGGAFFLYNIPRWNILNGAYMTEIGLTFRHWIAIDIKFGLPIPGRLYPSHYSMLYFTKGKPRSFTRPRVPIPVCRHCGGDLKDYGGHRDKLNPEGLNLTDVWNDIPPVRHRTTKNRSANELSEKLLERVLTIASQEGDRVLDPFGGSGTTYAVSERMHRHWTGVEMGDVEPIISRLTGQEHTVDGPSRGDAGKGPHRVRLPRRGSNQEVLFVDFGGARAN